MEQMQGYWRDTNGAVLCRQWGSYDSVGIKKKKKVMNSLSLHVVGQHICLKHSTT